MRYIYISILLLVAICIEAQSNRDSIFIQKIAEQQLADSTQAQRFDYTFYAAEQLKNQGKYEEAITLYIKSLSIDSTNAAAWFELSKMYQFTKNTQAYQTLLKAVKYAPHNTYYKEIEAAYYISMGEYNKAIKLFERLSKTNSSKTSYLYNLLNLYQATNKDKKYLATVKKLETLLGISEETTISKVNYYNKRLAHKKAITEINRLIEQYPYNTEYKTIVGQYYLSIGDTAAALNSLNELTKSYPNSGYVYMTLLEYYQERNDDKQVEFCMKKIIDDNDIDISEKINVFINYVEKLDANGNKEESEKFFGTLIDYYPKESMVYALYGAYLMEQKASDKAEDMINTAVSLNPEEQNNWIMLAQLHVASDSIERLIKVADEAEKLFPDNTTWAYYKVMGLVQLEKKTEAIDLIDHYVATLGDRHNGFKSIIMSIKGDYLIADSLYSAAFECYEKSLEFNPGNTPTLNNYAYFLSECNLDLAKAEKMSSKTIISEPQNSTYIDTYAWILFKQGDLKGAKFYIERALLYSDDADLLEHYGDILFAMGENEKAIEQWKKAKDKGGDSPTLQRKIDDGQYIEKPLNCK